MILAASETREVSINKLQDERIPDDQGRLLPISAKGGVVDWMTPESGDVTGRLMITSRDTNLARNFSCGTYKSECQLAFDTFANDIGINDLLEMYEANASVCINSQPLQCSNATTTNGTVNYSWNVGATNIIALNASTERTKPGPMLKGISAGSGTAQVTASAGACQSSGGGNPTVTSCSTPTGETSQYMRQTLTGSVSPTASDFIQTLQVSSGTGAQDNVAIVSEAEGAAGSDSCWWSASPYPAFTAVTGGNWTVGGITPGFAESQAVTPGSGQWGPDEVGYAPGPIKWYQQNRPKAGLILPCGAILYQGVSLTCPSKSPVVYATDTITTTIDSTGITNCRAGICGSHYAYQ
jgi:hypothetical protein